MPHNAQISGRSKRSLRRSVYICLLCGKCTYFEYNRLAVKAGSQPFYLSDNLRHTSIVYELICGNVVSDCYCPKAEIARNPVSVEKTHGRLLYFDAHNHRH